MASITFSDGLTRFETSKKTLRPKTVQHYRYLFNILRKAVGIAQMAERLISGISGDDLSQIVLLLDNPSYFPTMGDSTKTKLVKLLKSAFAWFSQNTWIDHQPAALLRFRRTYTQSTRPFTPKELADLLGVQPASAADRRDLCIWSVFADTGGRCEEICSLKLTDWNGKQLAISNGKGGKPRVVSMGQAACQMLQRYVDQDRPKGDDRLFNRSWDSDDTVGHCPASETLGKKGRCGKGSTPSLSCHLRHPVCPEGKWEPDQIAGASRAQHPGYVTALRQTGIGGRGLSNEQRR